MVKNHKPGPLNLCFFSHLPNHKTKHLPASHPDLKVSVLTPRPDSVQLCPDYCYPTNARIAPWLSHVMQI